MAKKKTSTSVTRVASPRSERLQKLAKVTSGITKTSSLLFNLEITYHQAQDLFGILAEENESQVILKCRPKSGSSKEGYLHINKADIIILEGSLGKLTRINCMRDAVIKHKNVSIKLVEGGMKVTSEDGTSFLLNNHPSIKTNVVAAEVEGEPKKKKKKKK